jgi:hypothetical protein
VGMRGGGGGERLILGAVGDWRVGGGLSG